MFPYSEQTSAKIIKVLSVAGKLPEDIDQVKSKKISSVQYLEEIMGQGVIKEDVICNILAKGFSLRRTSLELKDIDIKAFSAVPLSTIEEQNILPFAVDGAFLKIAVVDPIALQSSASIKTQTSKNFDFYLITYSEFKALFDGLRAQHVDLKAAVGVNSGTLFGGAKNNGAHNSQGSGVTNSNEKLAPRNKKQLRTKWPIFDQDLVVDFCDQILRQAINDRCSDIHIESFRDTARVRMRYDGALRVVDMYSEYLYKNYQAVTARFKILAGCDISEKRLAQDGSITVSSDAGKEIDFRFNLVPTKNGERIVMRILAGDQAVSLDKIGFDQQDLAKVLEAITAPQGMVLVTGPTGSGKTTTLYAALQYINSPDINILTVEDPIEYYLEGAGQVQTNDKIGLTFSEILRSFLRQDPEVILVGEIRDQETIDIAFKAALTGHLLLSTLHTNDAVSSITRMINMGVPNFLVASGLSLIIAQRLVRKNCKSCINIDLRVTNEVLSHIGFGEQELDLVKPKRGMGCAACNGTGLLGRRSIFEVLKNTPQLETAILENASQPQMLDAARADGFKSMQERGRELIQSGEISVEEYQHTLVLE
jgi:type IV pilus assembly protein PilB